MHTLGGHRGEVDSVGFSPDARILVSGSKDMNLRVWDVKTGELLATYAAHQSRVESLAFSPDGKLLATAGAGDDPTVKLWLVEALLAK